MKKRRPVICQVIEALLYCSRKMTRRVVQVELHADSFKDDHGAG